MFTGIVTAIGEIARLERGDQLLRIGVASAYDPAGIGIGASINHAGVCLTVVAAGPEGHSVEIAAESLAKTTLGELKLGDRINLERALKAGDELGGHIVSGHVDGVGRVLALAQEGEGWRLRIAPPPELLALIAPKGSICIDGVSMTVNSATETNFDVFVIPHTWAHTTLQRLVPGARVNLEVDMLARYVARILEMRR